MISKVLGMIRNLWSKSTSIVPESSPIYDIIVTGRKEDLTIFNLYRYGRLCGSGLMLDEENFTGLLEDLGITEYQCGFSFTEYNDSINAVAQKHDLVLLPNGTVLPRDKAGGLMTK